MPTNVGSQSVHTKFFDPLINQNTNFMSLDIRKTGIYSGGYITWTVGIDNSVTVSPMSCEISDSNGSGNQVRVTTDDPVAVAVSPSLNLVVLRWALTAPSGATSDYMTFGPTAAPSPTAIVPGTQLATDLVVGTVVFSGSNINSINYGGSGYAYRSDPAVFDLFLKVESYTTTSVILRAGRITYGSNTYIIPTQVITGFTPPSSGYYTNNLIQITTSGVYNNPIPAGAPTLTLPALPPAYNNLVTLAEVVILGLGSSTYSIYSVTDVRSFANSTATIDGILPAQTGYSGYYLETDGVSAYWNAVTTFPIQSGNSGYYLRTDGSVVYWNGIDMYSLLPTVAGNAGLSLVTNGATIYWGNATYA